MCNANMICIMYICTHITTIVGLHSLANIKCDLQFCSQSDYNSCALATLN